MTRAAFRLWLTDHSPDAIVGTGGALSTCPLARWYGTHVGLGHYERPDTGSWWPLPVWAREFAWRIDQVFPRSTVTAAEALAVLDGIPEETAHEPPFPVHPRAARSDCRECVA